MTWYLEPTYSALEVAIILVLAALPLSQIMGIALALLEKKTGISVGASGKVKEKEDTKK